jgi:hypothetical protein
MGPATPSQSTHSSIYPSIHSFQLNDRPAVFIFCAFAAPSKRLTQAKKRNRNGFKWQRAAVAAAVT